MGTILRQAAAAEFTAGAQVAATGNQMVQFGAAQTEAGIELLKPFKALKASREVLMADDIAIQAKLSLRAATDAMQSSGATPDTWGEAFQKEFSKTSEAALTAAGQVSQAAKEHVYKELQGEYLNLFTGLTVSAVKADGQDQLGMAQRKEDYELKEAIASRDPAARAAHRQSYVDTLDRMTFTKVLTPLERQQKIDHFDKRLREESIVQTALSKGLQEAFDMADSFEILPVEKDALKDRAEDALRFKVKAQEKSEKAVEKQLELDQRATYMTISGKVLTETNSENLLTLIYKIPEFMKTGVLKSEDGDKLKQDAEKRLDDLAKPNPEETIPGIFNDMAYRLTLDSSSVTDHEITSIQGLSYNDRQRLRDMKLARKADHHYSKLATYKQTVNVLRSYGRHGKPTLMFSMPGQEDESSDLPTQVVRAINTYEASVMALEQSAKRRLTEADLQSLDSLVSNLTKHLESIRYSTPAEGETLQSLTGGNSGK